MSCCPPPPKKKKNTTKHHLLFAAPSSDYALGQRSHVTAQTMTLTKPNTYAKSTLFCRVPVYVVPLKSGRFDIGNLQSYIECDQYFTAGTRIVCDMYVNVQ